MSTPAAPCISSRKAETLVYAYDLGDRVTQVTYPSGRIVQYGRDTKGRVNLVQTKAWASVGSWTTIASGYAYEPFAAVKAMTLGNGLSVANDWGNDGRLASRRLYTTSGGTNLSYLAYGYDTNDNMSSIKDLVDDSRSVYYGYDANDRLTQAVLTVGAVQSGTDSYSYTTGTNQLSTIAYAGGGSRYLSYDARGNLAGESRPGMITANTTYDSYARLTGYTRNDVGTLSFVYNGRDDRVAKTTSAGTRRFVYDPDGRVLGEYGTSATDVKAEFVWALPAVANDNDLFGGDDGAGGYMPLAVATPNSGGTIVLNWVHGNHLGVPLAATDSAANAAATPNDYQAPGFPGQSRTLADLYYNRYRDYDSTTGRYVQADPIGLEGGENAYVYVENSPLKTIDPLGLDTIVITEGRRDGSANVFGHSAMAFTGQGLYSFGNGQTIGSNVSNYLRDELRVRDVTIQVIKTNSEQEALMSEHFRRNSRPGMYNDLNNNCSTLDFRTLRAGGVLQGAWEPTLPMTPSMLMDVVAFGTGARSITLKKGSPVPRFLRPFGGN